MRTNQEIDLFVKDYARRVSNGDAAVFIGAGLSRTSGYVGWSELLEETAAEINLDVNKEKSDLISLAQYYINRKQRNKINEQIKNFFKNNAEHKPNETHLLLASLPIRSYWTTNYDRLIEQAFDLKGKIYSCYYSDKSLATSINNSEVMIHKMHGDYETPEDAIISRRDYEAYDETHEMMLAKFKGEMCSKTFLFLGYSFSDPDIYHILARIRKVYDKNQRRHYCLMKRIELKDCIDEEDFEYRKIKQEIQVDDFSKYGIDVILVDSYDDYSKILENVRKKVCSKNVLLSGAYEQNTNNKELINCLAENLSKWLIENDYKIHTGFGKNIGGYVIKGALDGCNSKNKRDFSREVIVYPFPYSAKLEAENKKDYYTRIRKDMVMYTGITILLCGEKVQDGKMINSPGVLEEMSLSKEQGNLIIPVGSTGGAALHVWENMQFDHPGIDDNEYELLNKELEVDMLIKVITGIVVKHSK